jgi:subfamily B ATP-binding cassette protein MsbA
MAYVGWRSQSGAMSVGDFGKFVASLLLLGKAMQDLAQLQATMSEGLAASRRLLAGIDIQPEVRDTASPRPLPAGPSEIVFDKVSFAYHADAPALSGLSIRAAPGETIALVGPSGGGKTTILNLIPRFYDPDTGVVSINGMDVRDTSMHELRNQIGLVMQEPFLFDDTIRANIAYSRPDASDAEVHAAAEAAAAHEFIEALPKGYDTSVGEAGARLSGGQRQRIAIARAFLKNAPILLLDEATSALDTESEAKVQGALERLMQGRTTVMIAHRLSTVRNADRIYVIEAGKVVEQGTHAALIRKGGLYSRLAKGQDLDASQPVAGAAE